MSLNKYRKHLIILPEDRANECIANGFVTHDQVKERFVQILPPSGGWLKVVDDFVKIISQKMTEYTHVVLLIDFDNDQSRLNTIQSQIQRQTSPNVSDRVFILGSLNNPEILRRNVSQSFDSIGLSLAKECFNGTRTLWNDEHLVHNTTELERLVASVRPFLF